MKAERGIDTTYGEPRIEYFWETLFFGIGILLLIAGAVTFLMLHASGLMIGAGLLGLGGLVMLISASYAFKKEYETRPSPLTRSQEITLNSVIRENILPYTSYNISSNMKFNSPNETPEQKKRRLSKHLTFFEPAELTFQPDGNREEKKIEDSKLMRRNSRSTANGKR